MNHLIVDAIKNGVYSTKNNRIDYQSIFGWSSIDRRDSFTSDEVKALRQHFGDEVIEKIGLVADEKGAAEIAARKAANLAASLARDAAKVRRPRDRDRDGDGFAEGLKNCEGL